MSSTKRNKQTKSSFHNKNIVLTTRPLELLHLDLFRPTRTTSLDGKKYGLVIIDDFSKFTWVIFLVRKDEACEAFKKFSKRVQNEKGFCIYTIRSNHGGEFKNHSFEKFCNENDISHNFSSARTPQQNVIVESKNKSLQEIATTMLFESGLSKGFWTKAVNTTCYIQNHVFLRPIIKKTPMNYGKEENPT